MRYKSDKLSIVWLLLLIFSQSPVNAFCQGRELNDTLEQSSLIWDSKTVRIASVPLILFAGSAATWGVREDVRTLRNRYLPNFRYHYDNYLQYAPAAAVLGLNAAGVKGKNKIGRALVSYAFSAAIMGSVVNAVKYTAKVERPDGSSRNSFPSGHTANSFMNASFLHKEYGGRSSLYSVGAYTAATATAMGRQMNNRHWISDVLAGAGIGIISTEVGYLIADHIFKEKGQNIKLKNNYSPISLKPSFIELRVGYAVALAKDLAERPDELFAKRGLNLGFEGAYFFNKHLGIGAEFAFNSFPINDDNINFGNGIISEVSDGHYTQPMGIRYIHAGPYLSLPLSRNWFITGKLNLGSSEGARGQALLKIKQEYQDEFGLKDDLIFCRHHFFEQQQQQQQS
ncbi:MAG: phosphatase PAP2 family protein, partial [Sphingobacteriales bacterium]